MGVDSEIEAYLILFIAFAGSMAILLLLYYFRKKN